jgi:hypothetical protein
LRLCHRPHQGSPNVILLEIHAMIYSYLARNNISVKKTWSNKKHIKISHMVTRNSENWTFTILMSFQITHWKNELKCAFPSKPMKWRPLDKDAMFYALLSHHHRRKEMAVAPTTSSPNRGAGRTVHASTHHPCQPQHRHAHARLRPPHRPTLPSPCSTHFL